MLLAAGWLVIWSICSAEDLPGLEQFGEMSHELAVEPGVTVTLNEPADLGDDRPVLLILYALPNGNTTAQTFGRAAAPGVHWRFGIQHIGAQTRLLRRALPERHVVTAYLEADTRSWPAWRANLEDSDARIRAMVEDLAARYGSRTEIVLTGHSGGGSFAWGYLNAYEKLPDALVRIAFLDSNYSYDDELRHGDKMLAWLKGDARRHLVVVAYDDREIELDGKKVVGPTGGTYRASHRMIERLKNDVELAEEEWNGFQRFRAPQVEILIHPNPANKILHTTLVGEYNGFVHALTVGTEDEGRVAPMGGPPAFMPFVAGGEGDSVPTFAPIPPRAPDAIGGRAFIDSVRDIPRDEREEAIARELLAGNIPDFLRELVPIRVKAAGLEGVDHYIEYRVMPDYLAIGSDEDYVRMPMNPYTAQKFLDAFGFVFPTAKMSDDIWAEADLKLDPRPLTEEREAPATFLQHHDIIEEQLGTAPRGWLVAGIKKDVVVTNRLQERPNRVAIYGWHYPDGKPIQPVTIVHVDWYVDYSHGVRPVHRMMKVDGVELPFEQILADPHLCALLSVEGPIAKPRYELGSHEMGPQ